MKSPIALYWEADAASPQPSNSSFNLLRRSQNAPGNRRKINENILAKKFAASVTFDSFDQLAAYIIETCWSTSGTSSPSFAIFLCVQSLTDVELTIHIDTLTYLCFQFFHVVAKVVLLQKHAASVDIAHVTSHDGLVLSERYVDSIVSSLKGPDSRLQHIKQLLDVQPGSDIFHDSMLTRIMSRLTTAPADIPVLPSSKVLESEHFLSHVDRAKVAKSIKSWNFPAHSLTYDELLMVAFLIIRQVLDLPQLEAFQISDSQLLRFLAIVRESYNHDNPYHNYRHAVDVLQATYSFLLAIGFFGEHEQLQDTPSSTAPKLSENKDKKPKTDGTPEEEVPASASPSENGPIASSPVSTCSSSIGELLSPTDGLALVIAAIGHDVGHPGVTNAFLVACNAPIAVLYNGRSVLESYHAAALVQMLQQYWPAVPQCKDVVALIVDSVLATDMGMHFDYMERVDSKIASGRSGIYNVRKDKTLVSCLLVKCADISNVARTRTISGKWGVVLGKEFGECSELEIDLGMKERASVPVVADPELSLAKGQIFFINTYAKPLFTDIATLLPQLSFTLDIIQENANHWTKIINEASQ